jgi:Flp pilus assembly protein TadG
MTIQSRIVGVNLKGQAMVEMALVIFFLVLLIFGMTEFGRAMYTKNTLTNAARAGARVAVVTPASSYPALSATSVNCSTTQTNDVYAAVCKGISGGGIQNRTVTITLGITNPAGAAQTAPATGYTITVTVQSNFAPVLALMRNMISATLSGQASMRYE